MKDIANPGNARFLMIFSCFIFGTIGVFTRFIDLPASVILMGRGATGCTFLVLIIYLLGSRIYKDDIYSNMFTLICSGVCLGLNWLFLFEAYKTIEVSVAVVCNYMTPAMVILVSPLVFKVKLTGINLACALMALFGLVLVSGVLDQSGPINSHGLLCGVMAAVFYTGLIIFNKLLKSIDTYDRTLVQLAIGTVVVTIYSLITVDFGTLVVTTDAIIMVAILGIVHTAIAFLIWFGALTYMDASSASIICYLEPLIAIILSVVLLHEDLGLLGWIGAAIILGSTFMPEVITHRKFKKMEAAENN